jgi:parvulin-like peptidyl-prolyl isomerase
MFIRQAVSRPTWEKRLKMQLLINKVIQADLGPRISVEPEDLSTYLKARAKRDETGSRVRIEQILVSSREEAKRIRREILDGEDFSGLAQRHSQAPEGIRGGDMGYLAPGDLPEALEKAVFALDEGEVSAVISSPYGYHIFKVLEKGPADGLDADFRLEKARKEIRRQKLEAAYRPWLDELRTRYKITVNNEMM